LRLLIRGLKRVAVGALVLCAALAVAARAQAPAEVSVRFAAVDRQNNPVESLNPEDLRVTENGRARAVTGVRRLNGLPLALVIALDTSASQERVLGGTKLAADTFARGVMRPGVDEVGVVTFTSEATLEQELTSDPEKVRAAIARVTYTGPQGYIGAIVVGSPPGNSGPPPGSTAVWDAVTVIAGEVLAREAREVRRALVLITDGRDTSSRLKADEAVRAALRAEAVVYAVGIGDKENFDGVDEGALRKLAARTGGRAFFPKKVEELPAILAQIRGELLSPYVVTFGAPDAKRDGSLRKIKLEVVNPELRRRGVRLLHPEAYAQ